MRRRILRCVVGLRVLVSYPFFLCPLTGQRLPLTPLANSHNAEISRSIRGALPLQIWCTVSVTERIAMNGFVKVAPFRWLKPGGRARMERKGTARQRLVMPRPLVRCYWQTSWGVPAAAHAGRGLVPYICRFEHLKFRSAGKGDTEVCRRSRGHHRPAARGHSTLSDGDKRNRSNEKTRKAGNVVLRYSTHAPGRSFVGRN